SSYLCLADGRTCCAAAAPIWSIAPRCWSCRSGTRGPATGCSSPISMSLLRWAMTPALTKYSDMRRRAGLILARACRKRAAGNEEGALAPLSDPHFAEGIADIIREEFRFLHGGEMAAAIHHPPSRDVVAALRP